jgi:SHS2 domain-containing protein
MAGMKAKGRRGKGSSREAKKKATAKPAKPRGAKRPFEFLDHPADVGFIAHGHNLSELFESAAAAVLEYGWELDTVRERERVDIRARAATLEDLLFSWLAELVYLADTEHWVFKRVSVTHIEPPHVSAPEGKALWEIRGSGHGERFDKARHHARTYIKAVTYHQLEINESPDGWQATVFLDV